MVLSSQRSDCENSPGSFAEHRTAPGGSLPYLKNAAIVNTNHRYLLPSLGPKTDNISPGR